MNRLEGRRAVVTGGAQGIGAAIARRLAEEGATVAVLDLTAQKAGEVLPTPHIGVACDVSDTASVDAAFAQVAQALGGIDILVNNAGVGSAPGDGMAEFYAGQAARADGDDSAFADQTIHCADEGWSRVLSVTLDGVFRCSRAAVRIMASQGAGGSIINIGSTAALAGNGPVPYVTAKAAVLGMTRAMARELAPRGIRVNAVNPGATEAPDLRAAARRGEGRGGRGQRDEAPRAPGGSRRRRGLSRQRGRQLCHRQHDQCQWWHMVQLSENSRVIDQSRLYSADLSALCAAFSIIMAGRIKIQAMTLITTASSNAINNRLSAAV